MIQGVQTVNASNNHFPCDCRIISWTNSALFANQSRERMMTNNFCISPYEVHGKSIQLAADDFHLLDDCPSDEEDVDESAVEKPMETELLETTKPSTLLSSRGSLLDRSCYESVIGMLLVLLFCTV